MASKPPLPPPTPPVRKSVMAVGPDLNRLPIITPDRAAVMQDIRNGPKLRKIDPSLINDRSQVRNSYQPETSIRKLISSSKENVSSRPPSVQSSIHSVGFKRGSTEHPASKSRSSISSQSSKGHHHQRSMSSLSSVSSNQYRAKRSPSPSADYHSVMGLYPRAARLLNQQKSTENLTQVDKVEKVIPVKRPAPPAPVKNTTKTTLIKGTEKVIPQVDVIKYRDVTYQRNLRNAMMQETAVDGGGSQRSIIYHRVDEFPKITERRTKGPAPLPPTSTIQNYTHAEFEAKFTFRMVTELPPARLDSIPRKTYPSSGYVRS